ncbi:MAG: hypothetical protein WBM35_02670 [Candidatus Electrothrix sp.]
MDVRFEKAFLKAVKKHAGIKKQIEQKVRQPGRVGNILFVQTCSD